MYICIYILYIYIYIYIHNVYARIEWKMCTSALKKYHAVLYFREFENFKKKMKFFNLHKELQRISYLLLHPNWETWETLRLAWFFCRPRVPKSFLLFRCLSFRAPRFRAVLTSSQRQKRVISPWEVCSFVTKSLNSWEFLWWDFMIGMKITARKTREQKQLRKIRKVAKKSVLRSLNLTTTISGISRTPHWQSAMHKGIQTYQGNRMLKTHGKPTGAFVFRPVSRISTWTWCVR